MQDLSFTRRLRLDGLQDVELNEEQGSQKLKVDATKIQSEPEGEDSMNDNSHSDIDRLNEVFGKHAFQTISVATSEDTQSDYLPNKGNGNEKEQIPRSILSALKCLQKKVNLLTDEKVKLQQRNDALKSEHKESKTKATNLCKTLQ